jgi:hypothetical protein
MIELLKSRDRGRFNYGWLFTHHSFSFGDYHKPERMGFRSLRVINEDRVTPGQGFGEHPHRDMEIISYVLEGALAHRDSTGGGGVLRNGDVQHMSAGSGVTHSEFNDSQTEPVHFLQIWIVPETRGLAPMYQQRHFDTAARQGRLCLVASHDGRDGSLAIRQDVSLYASLLAPGASLTHELAPGRHAWVQLAKGAISLNGISLKAGDGAAVSDERALAITATEPAELLVFDLA